MTATTRTSTVGRGARAARTRHVAVAIAVAIGLAACGGGDDDVEAAPTDATTDGAQDLPDGDAADEEVSDDGTDEGGDLEDEDADDGTGAGGDAPVTTTESSLGTILVTRDGMTLYGFTNDEQGVSSACAGDCLASWPALLVDGETLPAGLDPDVFGVITRDDGSTQLTADGWPLYTYAPDQAPGDTTGQGVGGVWFVVAPDGALVTTTSDADAGDDGDAGEDEDADGGRDD